MDPLRTHPRRRVACLLWLVLAPAAYPSEDASEYVEFSHDFDSKCVIRNGKMLQVRSNHRQRTIKVYLQRFYADRRQPGRTVQVLKPGAEAVGLGCTMVSGRPQGWKLIKARFLD